MKDYLSGMVDLTGDKYLNPDALTWNDNEGFHGREVNSITSVSIHHDASPRPHDYDSVARYHSEAAEHYLRLGFGLQYHFKIDNTGVIFKIRPHTTWLNCVGSAENRTTIAICLDGNFENQQPTREQLEALYQLLESLCEHHPEFPATWPNVRPHADFSATACCGANLRNRIYAIQDKASAQTQLLNQGDFDWPSLQPNFVPPVSVPVATPEAPAPAPKPVVVLAPMAPTSTVVVPPVAPANPPITTATSHDYSQENNALLQQIKILVQWIVDKLTSVFK